METVTASKPRNRKALSDLDVLKQATRVRKLVEQCGDIQRQKQVLELVTQVINAD